MRYTILVGILLCLMSCKSGRNWNADISTLPSCDMLLLDSVTVLKTEEFPKGNPIILLFFGPDCPFCKKETEQLLRHQDSLNHAQIYLLAIAPFDDIKGYSEYYHLFEYKNFTVGQDYRRSFTNMFKPKVAPYIAIYDRDRHLIKAYNGSVDIGTIIKALRS